ncbi:hypothetical protein ACT6NV_00695 [Robiginitalea sp. IMCC44478]|uniref:hypothetical protein n=1 Tax=Robiginitalea sp. IMCC44478 TaxID=3459122 RepID=UPI004042682D
MEINRIWLPTGQAKALPADLNTRLANFQTNYQNLRGIHWNLPASVKADDEGANAMMSDYITKPEKTVRVLKARLAEKV